MVHGYNMDGQAWSSILLMVEHCISLSVGIWKWKVGMEGFVKAWLRLG